MRRLSLVLASICCLSTIAPYAVAQGHISPREDRRDDRRAPPDDRRDDRRDGRRDDRRDDRREHAAGYEAALQVCASLRFDSERTACMDAVRVGELFQVEATQVCRQLKFGSEAVQCVSNIARKQYTPTELSICSNSRFGSEVNNCLARAGRPIDGRHDQDAICDVESILVQVQNARQLILSRAPNRALRVLDRAESQLLRCR